VEIAAQLAVLVWSFKAGAPADAPPLVAEGRVFYAVADKKIYVVRLDDGKELWSRRFRAPLPVTPVLEDELVYQYVPYPEGYLYALRVADGKVAWRARAGPGVVCPAAGDGVVAVGRGDDAVFYDSLSGEEVARVKFDEAVVGAAYGGGGAFLVWTGGGRVAACRPGEAEPVWRTRVAASGVFGAVASGRAYLAAASGDVACYDVSTGEEVWRDELNEPLAGAPVVAGDALFVAGRRSVFACSASGGEVLWTFNPGGNVVGVAAAGGRAVVACEDGRLFAASAQGSEELLRLDGYAAAAPAVAAGFLLAADGENRLHCFKFE